jgi:hypothetical protein
MKNAIKSGLMRHRAGSMGTRTKRRLATLAVVPLLPLLMLGSATACWAQSNAAQPAVPPVEVGHATRNWLELQRSNGAAAPAQPMLGAEAGLAYKRYLASFDAKIPTWYGSLMNQSSGGGSQSGGVPQN